jgi:hypothetical protein
MCVRNLTWAIRLAVCGLALIAIGQLQAAVHTVITTSNAGQGSLRWAIKQANGNPGLDYILFDPNLAGKAILPTAALPTITDEQTIIQGDIDGDQRPDIVLNGTLAGATSGLTIAADFCHVDGLCVVRFQQHGIYFTGVSGGGVYNCYVGVNRSGTTIARNGGDQIRLWASDHVTIGRATPPGRNTIAAGSAKPFRAGISVANSSWNTVTNNTIGIGANGETALTAPHDSGAGVIVSTVRFLPRTGGAERPALLSAANNRIGTNVGERNVFGGMRTGVLVSNANTTTIQGNYFGLGRDGDTRVPIRDYCVHVRSGSRNNSIGGSSVARRNVISGGKYGVVFEGARTADNFVVRNDFGLNGAGTAERPLVYGVLCRNGAEAQTIVRNSFGSMHPKMWTIGVFLDGAGGGSYVSRNAFGLPPAIKPVTHHYVGVALFDSYAVLTENTFRRSETGIYCYDNPLTCKIIGNRFRACDAAVRLQSGADVNLGNLANNSPSDDGGNGFYASNNWYIRNESASYVKAEGNHFPTSNPLLVNFKIWDKLDDATRGRVDISPMGDVLADTSTEAPLTITSTSAAPTPAGGAEILFTLSSAANVTVNVLNIAGRPVRTLCQVKDCQAGANTLLWNAQSDAGLPVPNGMYLVEVTAKADDGTQGRALAQVAIRR